MGRSYEQSLKDSMGDYKDHIQPVLEQLLSGQLLSVEGDTLAETSRMLDTLAGIDLWWMNPDHGMRGVASRIQPGSNWRTFTIRKSRESGAQTEYEKRKAALENEYLYPAITYQAYVGDHGLSLGIAKTKQIIEFIDRGLSYTRKTGTDQKGQAEFYVIPWDKYRLQGYRFMEWLNGQVLHRCGQ